MSQEFVEKIVTGFDDGSYRIELNDHILVLCAHDHRMEGELLGYCPEGLVVDIGGAVLWVNAECIWAVGKVQDGGGGGGGREASVPQGSSGRKLASPESGQESMEKVFFNGTR